MKNSFFYSLIFVCSMIFFSSLAVKAQNPTAFGQEPETTPTKPPRRPNLLRELQLTPDQIRQIRQINQEKRRNRIAAQSRLKEANESLNTAIYGESDSDAQVEARVRDVHAAQLEVLQNRVSSEQSIRRLLTPQQLGKFRRLKQQYDQTETRTSTVEDNPNQRPNRPLTPRQQRLRRIENRQRRQANR